MPDFTKADVQDRLNAHEATIRPDEEKIAAAIAAENDRFNEKWSNLFATMNAKFPLWMEMYPGCDISQEQEQPGVLASLRVFVAFASGLIEDIDWEAEMSMERIAELEGQGRELDARRDTFANMMDKEIPGWRDLLVKE